MHLQPTPHIVFRTNRSPPTPIRSLLTLKTTAFQKETSSKAMSHRFGNTGTNYKNQFLHRHIILPAAIAEQARHISFALTGKVRKKKKTKNWKGFKGSTLMRFAKWNILFFVAQAVHPIKTFHSSVPSLLIPTPQHSRSLPRMLPPSRPSTPLHHHLEAAPSLACSALHHPCARGTRTAPRL